MDYGDDGAGAAVLDLLGDDYSRCILRAADERPRTAKGLSDRCDASLATVYRRISSLERHGLVENRSTVDAEGAHKQVFETTLEELQLSLTGGELSLWMETRDELADSFTSLWDDLRDEQ